MPPQSAELTALASIARALQEEYCETPSPDPWAGSPFAWLRKESSRRRGAIGEQLLDRFLSTHGFRVERSKRTQADRIVNGRVAEVKFSTLWASGVYKFQQIRDQDYELLLCLGVSPYDAHGWAIPKHVIADHVIGRLGQHGGRSASETGWISLRPGDPPEWMRPWGGTLRTALEALRRLAPPRP